MANTKSAKKNIRASLRKKSHNTMWKESVKKASKVVKEGLTAKSSQEELAKKLQALQKTLDKASKNKAIHKNKANRLKSKYARKISALLSATPKKQATKRKSSK